MSLSSEVRATPVPAVLGPRGTRPRWERRYARLLPVGDLLLLLAVAGGTQLLPGSPAALALPLFLGWGVALAMGGAYESRVLGQGSEEYKRVVSASWHYLAFLAIGSYVVEQPAVREFLFVGAPIGVVVLLLGRQTVRRYVWSRRRRGFALHRLVVVGPPFVAAEVIREISGREDTGFRVVGVCTSGLVADGMCADVDVIGEFHDVLETIARTDADTVAVVGSADMPTGFIRRLAWQLEGTGVDLMVSPAITDVAGPRIHVRPVANLSLLYVEAPQFTGTARFLKSALDRLVAAVLLVLLLPLLVGVALAVVLTSRGPALFRQRRLGLGGRAFTIWKFRTMHVHAEAQRADLEDQNEVGGGLFKIRTDPRITRVGGVLRRLSLDELPQLVNVLLGQMSLVGPRPLPVPLEDFGLDERRRLLVKPGMTGLWQVSGRSDLTWEESVRLDLYYVENWSPAADLVILLRTVIVVLRGHGAY